MVLVVLASLIVCAFSYLPLKEGTLLFAVLERLHALCVKYVGFFANDKLSSYNLVPLAVFCILVLVSTICGAGFVSFVLKCIAFYSLYLLFVYAQSIGLNDSCFEITKYLPPYYQYLAFGLLTASCVLLISGWISNKRKHKAQGASNEKNDTNSSILTSETKDGSQVSSTDEELDENSKTDSLEEPQKIRNSYCNDPDGSRKALKSLNNIVVPSFDSFPNYSIGSTVSSIDRTIYDVTEKEAKIKREQQERKRVEAEHQKALEEERLRIKALAEEKARKEEEENRRKLEAMFKPRTLMKRLSDEAQTYQDFPTYSQSAPKGDFGISNGPLPNNMANNINMPNGMSNDMLNGSSSVSQVQNYQTQNPQAQSYRSINNGVQQSQSQYQAQYQPQYQNQAQNQYPAYEISSIQNQVPPSQKQVQQVTFSEIPPSQMQNPFSYQERQQYSQSQMQMPPQVTPYGQMQVPSQMQPHGQPQMQGQFAQQGQIRPQGQMQGQATLQSQFAQQGQMQGQATLQSQFASQGQMQSNIQQDTQKLSNQNSSIFAYEESSYESYEDDYENSLEPDTAIFKEETIRADKDMKEFQMQREAKREAQKEVQKEYLKQANDLRNSIQDSLQNDSKKDIQDNLQNSQQDKLQRDTQKELQTSNEENDDDIDAAQEKYRIENQQNQDNAKGPDIDYVSGVAGLKSSAAGNSYLIDKQKFVYNFPPETMLKHYPVSGTVYEDVLNDPEGMIIVDTLRQFRILTKLIGVQHGPTFTLYELALQKGVRVNAVLTLADNLAMELSVASVRILAPIPGKPAIGIEVPNKKRDTIGFDVMMPALKSKTYKIPMVLGKTITGDSIVIDLAKTPHLLVAGTTGSGKSVCINGLICSVLFTKTPKEVRMLLVDPKMVELSVYNGIPHLLTPVITDAKKALKAMNFIVEEMERRMALFASVGARKIEDYNEKIVEKGLCRVKLPYIMVIIDEFADLMTVVGKELEASIKRITAVARFCGIHLVLATQRPSSDVITGIIKSNIPTQIAFAVSNALNSRIIIDTGGAEKLLGRGDMLYNSPEARVPVRIQGAYIDSEIEEIVSFVKTQGQPDYIDESYFEDDNDEDDHTEDTSSSSGSEDLFSKAWKIVSDRGEASASYLQRRLNIGYNRAANLIEQMEDAGYIGPARGSKPREILKMYGSD